MNILITGSLGLIGSRFAKYLLDKYPDANIIGVDDWTGGLEENHDPRIRLYNLDCADDDLADIFRTEKPDYVIHAAAMAAEIYSPFIRKFNYYNNVVATANVINNCINYNIKRILYFSSIAVYGHGTNKLFEESDICIPQDCYGNAKLLCENDLKIANHQHGLDYVIIRPHNVVGVGQNIFDTKRNLFGIWMYNKLHNLPWRIYGDGNQTRAFTVIDNILPCLAKALFDPECSKETINLGGIKEYSINEIAQIMQNLLGRHDILHAESRFESKYSVASFEKSITLLDYQETKSLEKGILEMFDWAKTLPDRKLFEGPKPEITKGLYSYWKKS